MTTCTHPVKSLGATRRTGTPAVCRECKAYVWLPPARVHEGEWVAGHGATIPGMGRSAKSHYEEELEMAFASHLADEGKLGARE